MRFLLCYNTDCASECLGTATTNKANIALAGAANTDVASSNERCVIN